MKPSDEIRDLFARYAADVGRYLPSRGRADLEREIASNLSDSLEDDSGAKGREPTLDDAVELLRKTGHPRVTAASFRGEQHLVGPGLYPVFALACRIALPVVAVAVLASLLFAATIGRGDGAGIGEQLLGILGSTVSSALQAFAVIVIVFLLIERFDPRLKAAPAPTDWDPRRLPRVRSEAGIRLSEQILSLVFNTIFIAVLVLLPPSLPVIAHPGGPTIATLNLSDSFRRLVPLLVALCGIEGLAALFLMSRRVHTTGTRIVSITVKLCAVAMLAALLSIWPFVVLPTDAGGMELVAQILNQAIRGAFLLGVLFSFVDIVREGVHLVRASSVAAS